MPVVACIKKALDRCVASRQVFGPDLRVWVWLHPGLARDPTDLLVRTSRRAMVFKAGKPPSRLSRATPKWCRSTLSLRQLPFQLRGSEADEGCMRENPPLATTGCDEVLCTAATEAS